MTDYFERAVEIEQENGIPFVRITRDRAALVAEALKQLGVSVQVIGPNVPYAESVAAMPTPHSSQELVFEPGSDVDEIQDLLDEMSYVLDRDNQGTVWRRVL